MTVDRSGVSVWAPSLYQYYSMKPVLDEIRRRGAKLRVFCLAKHIRTLAAYLDLPSDRFLDIPSFVAERFGARSQALRIADGLYQKVKVSPRFSVMYSRIRREGRLEPFLDALLPRQSDARINETYHRFFQDKVPRAFDGGTVLAITPIMRPYWLAPVADRVVTLVESWDHPIKRPFLHKPRLAFTWNEDLARDLTQYQGEIPVDTIFPMKFRYIAELQTAGLTLRELVGEIHDSTLRRHVESLPDRPYLLYIATSSSRNPGAFRGELELIEDMGRYARDRGLPLYIKPKPNGLPGEFQGIEQGDDVRVGIEGTGSATEDLLNPDYHLYRYVLLKRAGLVINVGTTFGLEASLTGVPILQLELKKGERFGLFAEYARNPHIERYLLLPGLYRRYGGKDLKELGRVIDEGSSDTFSRQYSAKLRDWIVGNRTFEGSVRRIADVIMARDSNNEELYP